ncbi:MAG: ABC transporter ATP-binding protein [Victivallales bacterium]|nr:ABC transporter ATP-binding protein [Victivallales bacterium]
MSEKEIMISCRGVSKVFYNFWGQARVKALDGLDFEIRQGTVTGLLGPNGAGKSTLIKILLGHLYPTSGDLRVLGESPRDVKAKERIGYLPERTSFYTNLTARETLIFFADLLGLERREAMTRISQLLKMVGLDNIGRRLVGEFSHGMRKRLGLAQALLNDPDLLLLDEPTAGMDPVGCREIKDLIVTLRERGKTIVLTTHLLADVQDVGDTIMILYGGHLHAAGKIEELLSRPEEITIRCPSVSEDKIERARKILIDGKDCPFEVTHPIRTLEDYFLSVVQEAGASNIEISGARRGEGVAQYLRNGLEEEKNN